MWRPVLGSLVIAAITLGVALEGDTEWRAATAVAYALSSALYAGFAWAEHRADTRDGKSPAIGLRIEIAAAILVIAPLMLAALFGVFFATFDSA